MEPLLGEHAAAEEVGKQGGGLQPFGGGRLVAARRRVVPRGGGAISLIPRVGCGPWAFARTSFLPSRSKAAARE